MKLKILLILLSLATVTSCLKKMDLSDDNLGPAIDPVVLTKTLGQAFGTFDYNEIKPNEFTSVMQSQKIQDSNSQNLQQEGISVTSMINDSEKLFLDLVVQTEEYKGGQTTLSAPVAWPLTFKKAAAKAQSDMVQSQEDARPPVLTFLTFQALAFGSCYDEGRYPETCHRLTSKDIQYRVPIAAQNQHNCADPNNCYIPAKEIEFDMISKYATDKDGKPVRTHYTIILSPSVPFLSRVLKICTRGIYEISNDQKILADLCYSVNNYRAGSTPPPQ